MPSDDDLHRRLDAASFTDRPVPDFASRLRADVRARNRRRAVIAPAGTVLAVMAVVAGLTLPGNTSRQDTTAVAPIIETAPPTPGPSRTSCPSRGRGLSRSPAPTPSPVLLPPASASLSRIDTDGSLTWRRYVPVDGSQNPATAPLLLGDQAIAVAGGTLRSYDVDTGEQKWAVAAEGEPYGLWLSQGTVVALLDQVSPHGRVVGYDPQDGSVRWEHPLPGNGLLGEQVLAPDGALIVILTDGRVQALDTADGQVRWTAAAPGGPYTAVGGDVVVQPSRGRLVGLRLSDGTVAWRSGEVDDRVAPQAAGDVIVTSPTAQGIGIDTGVHAFDAATGKELWSRTSTDADQALRISATTDETVLVADDNFSAPTLTRVDRRTGAPAWTIKTRTVYGLQAVVGETAIAVMERRGETYVLARLDPATGAQLSETQAAGEQQPVALPGDRAVLPTFTAPDDTGAAGTNVQALSLATGQVLFAAQVPHLAPRITALPDGALLLQGSDSPEVFCAW